MAPSLTATITTEVSWLSTTRSIVPTRWAMAPSTTGTPLSSCQPNTANGSSTPKAKPLLTTDCSGPRTLRPTLRPGFRKGCIDALVRMHTRTEGGSADAEVSEETVIPRRTPASSTRVSTATPCGTRSITELHTWVTSTLMSCLPSRMSPGSRPASRARPPSASVNRLRQPSRHLGRILGEPGVPPEGDAAGTGGNDVGGVLHHLVLAVLLRSTPAADRSLGVVPQ